MQKGINSLVGVIALFVAVIALLIGIGAYNNSGGDLEQEANTTIDETAARLEQTANNAQETVEDASSGLAMETREAAAALALRQVRDDIEDKSIGDETYEDLDAARDHVNNAYDGADANMQTTRTSILSDIDELEAAIRANSANAMQLVNDLIGRLEDDGGTETDSAME